MLSLPNITLIALSGIGHKQRENAEALKISTKEIEFGAVKYIQLGEVKDIDTWNKAIIYELHKYVETSHALLVHGDGYVINPHLWREKWIQYDYIGAPWPKPQDNYSYLDDRGHLQRVGNSVSLRSKKLMDAVARTPEDYFWSFKTKYGNTNEDGYISCHNRSYLERLGCKFAPLEEAIYFSKEHELPENQGIETFAFHQVDL